MNDIDRYRELAKKNGSKNLLPSISEDEIISIADKAIAGGVKVVLLKCGTRGMYLRTAKPAFLSREWWDRELWAVPYQAPVVRSTTGAGDTAIAGFLCAVSAGLSPEDAVSLGSYVSSVCVASYDTCGSITKAEEMLKEMRTARHMEYKPQLNFWKTAQNHEGIFYGKKDSTQRSARC